MAKCIQLLYIVQITQVAQINFTSWKLCSKPIISIPASAHSIRAAAKTNNKYALTASMYKNQLQYQKFAKEIKKKKEVWIIFLLHAPLISTLSVCSGASGGKPHSPLDQASGDVTQ